MNEQETDPATTSVCPWARYFPSLCLDSFINKTGLIIPALFLPQICYKGSEVVLTVSRWDSVKSDVRRGAVMSTVVLEKAPCSVVSSVSKHFFQVGREGVLKAA